MSQVSKNELKFQNSVSFPNNNSGEISPADLRNFNVELIDSTVNQTLYTEDSSSFDGRIDSNTTEINNIYAFTASVVQEITSLESFTSSQEGINTAQQVTNTTLTNEVNELLIASTSFEDKFAEISVQSGSWGADTGSYLTTGSNNFVGDQTITGSLNVSGSLTASLQEGYIWVGNNDGVSVLFPTSSLTINTSSLVDLTEYNQFTQSTDDKLTNLINATSSYADSASVAQVDESLQLQIDSLSILTGSYATTGSNTFVGNQTITGSVTISGSAGDDLVVIGNVKVTGSALIQSTNGVSSQYLSPDFGGNVGIVDLSNQTEIGLALDGATWTTNWVNGPILYVNNTPGDTYEGVFGFQNKANYTDGRITALKPLDVLGTLSLSPQQVSANTVFPIPFLSSSVVSVDSVQTLQYNPSTNVLQVSGSTGASLLSQNNLLVESGSGAGLQRATLGRTFINSFVEGGSIGMSGNLSKLGAPPLASFTRPCIFGTNSSNILYPVIELQTSQSFTDGTITVKVPLDVSGSVDISGSLSINNDIFVSSSDIFLTGSGASFINIFQPSPGDPTSAIRFYSGSTIDQTGRGGQIRVAGNGTSINIGSFGAGETSLVDFDFQNLQTLFSQNLRVVGSKDFRVVGSGSDEFSLLGPRGVLGLSSGSSDITFSAANPLANTINRGTTEPILIDIYNAESTLSISITATGSFIQDFSAVTNVNENAIKLQPYSDYQRGQVTILRDLDVSGSTFVSGSVRGNVASASISSNTASLDFGSSNFFTLTLVSGSSTHILPQNVGTGQTINLKVVQPSVGTGTISFPSSFKFPEVAPYTASIVTSSVDVVTFITFEDTGSIYSVAVKRLV
jgi:hypothetical protein